MWITLLFEAGFINSPTALTMLSGHIVSDCLKLRLQRLNHGLCMLNVDTNYITFSGDLGQTFNSLSTLEHCMDSGAQAVLFVGDLSYADRYDHNDVGVRWDTWGRFLERSAAYQPWIWSIGNHEIEYYPHLVIT